MKMPKARTRRYIYGVAMAAVPLLVAIGVVSDDLAPLVVAMAGAILVPGMALANATDDRQTNGES